MKASQQIRSWILVLSLALTVVGCATEDISIVDPAPGSRRIVARLFNMITDESPRKLVMEQGFESGDVPSLSFSDTVRSPGDSSLIRIFANGIEEYRSPRRVRFIQNSVYSIFAVPKTGKPDVFDTVLITNANAALTTLPVAQVRVVNLIPDTNRLFDVRLGCPNGLGLLPSAVAFRQASVYREVFPGVSVFSVVDRRGDTARVIGTFECNLTERSAYSIVIYRDEASDEPLFTVIEETDLSRNAARPFARLQTRTADVRVANLSSQSVDVRLAATGQTLAKGLGTARLGSIVGVPTCEQQSQDVIEATFANGEVVSGATSLSVRGKFSVYTVDLGSKPGMVIVPTLQRPFGASGKAVVRVVNAASTSGSITVSSGARTNVLLPNGISSGATLARSVETGRFATSVSIDPGEVPLTVTTAATPTNVLRVCTSTMRADASYDVVVYDRNGAMDVMVIEQQDADVDISPVPEASLVTLVHGMASQQQVSVSLANVLAGGTLHYGNSITSSVVPTSPTCTVNGVETQLSVKLGMRTLAVYSDVGGTPQILQFTNLPLMPQSGITKRRVINATRDVSSISVCLDSIPSVSGVGDHFVTNVQAGTSSEVVYSQQDRRGTLFFYDAQTRVKVYTLPVQLATLGNNFTLIVVGNKERGYEVIVSQEF